MITSSAAGSVLVTAPAACRFARLEYGKFAESRGGVVERMEASRLAMSDTFPPDVAKYCRPDRLNLGEGVSLSATTPGAHGTIVRPLLAHGHIYQVAAALGLRSENGETVPGRPFWMGRYLLAAEPASPLECLAALRAFPWGAPLRADVPDVLPPVSSTATDPPAWTSEDAAFVGRALVFVISGIPVHVTGGIGEDAFFRAAELVWHRVPPVVRGLLGCGWGVSASLARDLSLAAVRASDGHAAVFDIRSGSWAAPVSLAAAGSGAKRPFDEKDALSGRMFVRELFPWSDGRLDVSVPPRFEIYESVPAPAAPHLARPLALGLQHPETRDALRAVGFRALDFGRLADLEAWMTGGATPEPDTLCLSNAGYFSEDAVWRVGESAIAALGDPAARPRAEQAIWRSLRGPRHEVMERQLARAGAERARLLGAVWRRSAPDALAALDAMRGSGGVGAVIDEFRPALDETLDQTLTIDSAPFHVRFLSDNVIAEPYGAWASARASELAIVCAMARGEDAVRRLRALADAADPVFAVLDRWTAGQAPVSGHAGADAVSPRLRQRLEELVVAAWSSGGAMERERALPWVRWCSKDATDDTLWRLAHGIADLSDTWLRDVAAALTNARVPPALLSLLAGLAVTCWPRIAPLTHYAGQWNDLFDHWPPGVRLALTATESTAVPFVPDPLVVERCARPGLDAATLVALVAAWERTPVSSPSRRDAAECLVNWIGQLPPRPFRATVDAVDLCASVRSGQFAHGAEPEIGEQRLAIRLLASVVRPDAAQALWESARAGWQFELVLRLFPAAALPATPRALEALVARRDTIEPLVGASPHLRDFAIVLRDFHAIPYPGKDAYAWRDAYGDGAIWAAFGGVPLDRQGSLRDALNVYARSGSERVRLARRYLRMTDVSTPAEYGRVVRAVIDAVVRPLAERAGLGRSDLSALLRHFGLPDGSRLRVLPVFRRARVVLTDEGPGDAPLGRGPGIIAISSPFAELLTALAGGPRDIGATR